MVVTRPGDCWPKVHSLETEWRVSPALPQSALSSWPRPLPRPGEEPGAAAAPGLETLAQRFVLVDTSVNSRLGAALASCDDAGPSGLRPGVGGGPCYVRDLLPVGCTGIPARCQPGWQSASCSRSLASLTVFSPSKRSFGFGFACCSY